MSESNAPAAGPQPAAVEPPVAPAAPVAGSGWAARRRRADAASRAVLWALALGVLVTVAFALSAPPLTGPISEIAVELSNGDLGRSAIGLALLQLLQALLVVAVVALAFLVAELSPLVGAGAGVVAAVLPAIISAAAEGLDVLWPALLVVVRVSGGFVAAGAGALGILLGRAIERRLRK